MKTLTHFKDHTVADIQILLDLSLAIKRKEIQPNFSGKVLGMLFFNPSLRTRVSFETAMLRFGGQAIALSGGKDTWALEQQEGVVMNGFSVEHIKDAAKVLSRLCDAIAIRSFAGMTAWEEDLRDDVIRSFQKYASKPVISMESAMEHPCQALADMLTIKEQFSSAVNKKLVITWAPHIKALPLAVPHSALLTGAYLGMDITLVHPPEFSLASDYVMHAAQVAEMQGGSLHVANDQKEACAQADVIYAKAWGSTAHYGDKTWHDKHLPQLLHWKVDAALCSNAALFLHCLPVRRNLEVADDLLDSPKSGIYDQAENRFWAQSAILTQLFG